MFGVQKQTTTIPRRKGKVLLTEELNSPISEKSTAQSEINEDPTPSEYESSTEDAEIPIPPHTILKDDPFSSETSRILFDAIDELRRLGSGEELQLPQLVLVGKQSAGKSSLLQSLTDIPFPVGRSLCTRFATRIVSRRTEPGTAEVVKASIERGDVEFGNIPDEAQLKAFEQVIPSMTAETFDDLIKKAKGVMGIDSKHGSEYQSFSCMVLKIELTGPSRSHFAILDVPGIFQTKTDKVTQAEMLGVSAMVCSYLKGDHNIIICVLDATDNLANQGILSLAQNVDNSRLVGVLTKCDQVQTPEEIVEIVQNGEGMQNKNLRWYVVQNRGPKPSVDFNRGLEEKETFNKDVWGGIPSDRRGTPMLKAYLANLLCQRNSQAFPMMKEKLGRLLQKEKSHRNTYGDARTDHNQRLGYLNRLVIDFQHLAGKALNLPWDLPHDDMKLRGKAQRERARFTAEITANGLLHNFLAIDGTEEDHSDFDGDSDEDSNRISVSISRFPSSITPNATPPRQTKSPRRVSTAAHPLYREIRKQMGENRGEELPGMLNPAILKPLWILQTSKWQGLAEKYLENVVKMTTTASLKIFAHVVQQYELPRGAAVKLEAIIQDFDMKSKSRVLQQLQNIFDKYADMALQTSNPDFQAKVRLSQKARFRAAMERFQSSHPPAQRIAQITTAGFGGTPVPVNEYTIETLAIVDLDEKSSNLEDLFNELHPNGRRTQNTEDEIHDILRAYYDISLQNFLYDVLENIVEPFLKSSTGPLLGLNGDYIHRLSESEVEELGGEDVPTVKGRQESDWQIKKYEKAMEIAEAAWRRTREIVF